jgi:co-chaperonin GroES (HSP10)
VKQPLFARVVVQPVPIEKIQGGVHIPDSVNTRPIEGHVIATGPLVTYVKVGEKVYYSKYAGQDMRTEFNG